VQAEAPAAAAKDPVGQSVQVCAPWAAKLPGSQVVQRPLLPGIDPAAQLEAFASAVASRNSRHTVRMVFIVPRLSIRFSRL
jgi:hypothetical protein